MNGGSSSCSTCAGNTHAAHPMATQSGSDDRISTPSSTQTPTPATKPKTNRGSDISPEPTPDPSARYENQKAQREKLAIGSGVTANGRLIVARPVSSNAKQSMQGKPRLVTNPR